MERRMECSPLGAASQTDANLWSDPGASPIRLPYEPSQNRCKHIFGNEGSSWPSTANAVFKTVRSLSQRCAAEPDAPPVPPIHAYLFVPAIFPSNRLRDLFGGSNEARVVHRNQKYVLNATFTHIKQTITVCEYPGCLHSVARARLCQSR